jgi:hypothetical protein
MPLLPITPSFTWQFLDELIEKMRTVNEWLKTKKAMNTQMGSEIYEICNALKIQGKQFEEGHKGKNNI